MEPVCVRRVFNLSLVEFAVESLCGKGDYINKSGDPSYIYAHPRVAQAMLGVLLVNHGGLSGGERMSVHFSPYKMTLEGRTKYSSFSDRLEDARARSFMGIIDAGLGFALFSASSQGLTISSYESGGSVGIEIGYA